MTALRQPLETSTRPATYQDVGNAPPHRVAEILAGTLHLQPRPAARHAWASSAIGAELHTPFRQGSGGPGGWWIVDEPELHLGEHILVPGIAGWRLETMPTYPDIAFFRIAPTASARCCHLPLYASNGRSSATPMPGNKSPISGSSIRMLALSRPSGPATALGPSFPPWATTCPYRFHRSRRSTFHSAHSGSTRPKIARKPINAQESHPPRSEHAHGCSHMHDFPAAESQPDENGGMNLRRSAFPACSRLE